MGSFFKKKLNMHENLDREFYNKDRSSDRSFGLVMFGFFLFLGSMSVIQATNVRWWAFALSGIFLAISFLKPNILGPLNKAWLKIGLLLQAITSPLIMGILFYGLLSPFALLMKFFGKDPINKNFDATLKSYWKVRQLDNPAKGMQNQF